VHVYCSRLDVGGRLPHYLEQHVAGLNSSLSFRQQVEELELCWGQLDIASIYRHAVGGAVDRKRSDLLNLGSLPGSRLHATKDRADTQHELLRAEGLCEIVVRAER
jgi:hypothetical protein